MIYAILHMNIENKDALGAYLEHASDALEKYGGKVVDKAAPPTVLQSSIATPDMAALLSFPDKDAAIGWRDDPAHKSIHALRRDAGPGNIFLLG